jgi:hypothetical protein
LQKISFILVLLVFCTGCSVIRIGKFQNSGILNEIEGERLLENIIKQNITRKSFFIQKAEIEVSKHGSDDKFLANIKFKSPDKYLVTLKSKTGIEVARIFISNDTILMNDRINRKQYFGSSLFLKDKYGISASVLPLIFGDYINTDFINRSNTRCSGGKIDIDCLLKGNKIKYVIDCNKGKCIFVSVERSLSQERLEIHFNDFLKKEGYLIPRNIKILDSSSETEIKIKIIKIESSWDGSVEFVPGNKFEIIQLL